MTSAIIILATVVFWLCFFFLLHSYVLFPAWLGWLAKGKKQNTVVYAPASAGLPHVSILLAVYNEEAVIARKISSTFHTSYPQEKIEFIIGSDASTDDTNAIIRRSMQQYPGIKFREFSGRTGKCGIINQLSTEASHDIFILTDANVFFRPDTIYQLVKHYQNPAIALVGGNILNERLKRDGISIQEKSYLSRENLIKYQEGVVWGSMIGAFGGCYSLRRSHYTQVPPRFIVDDFYITMHALGMGGKTINELGALCTEDASNKISEEFRRKLRISIGNFQNFSRFGHMAIPFWQGTAFAFLSHKVLRWLGPFFIILMLLSTIVLAGQTLFFSLMLLGQALLLLVPLLDWALRKAGLHISLLRFISHFYLMNLALLIGFFKYIRGVKSNIWRPTERYQ